MCPSGYGQCGCSQYLVAMSGNNNTTSVQDSHFVSDSPPAYSDLGYNIPRGPSNTGPLENEVNVSLQEVEQALTRNAPHLDLTVAQKETIKRLTESFLKRNVRKQGVLPTSLQKQFTLEHVISKFDKTLRTGHRNPFQTFSSSSSQIVTESPIVITMMNTQTYVQQSETVIQREPVISTPTFSTTFASHHGGRTIIGNWGTYTGSNSVSRIIHAYDDQIPRTVNCMISLMVIFCFIGSPFSLFCTVPAVYWICKVIPCS